MFRAQRDPIHPMEARVWPYVEAVRNLPRQDLMKFWKLNISFRTASILAICWPVAEIAAQWPRHTIDTGSKGADGVRVADFNRDGRLDIVTGWEEGGAIRICLNPGGARVRQYWPAVAVGSVASPEDAVWFDVDGDGVTDVVSSCEGTNRRVFVHWAPRAQSRYVDSSRWTTEEFPAVSGKSMWMYSVPAQIDGLRGTDLVIGGKGNGAVIGWLCAPPNPRDVSAWRFHTLREAGWIMSLRCEDLDQDGDLDILTSDRKGLQRGVYWLENPGSAAVQEGRDWPVHAIGAANSEVMFLDWGDTDGDHRPEIVVAVKPRRVAMFRPQSRDIREPWFEKAVELPDNIGTAKAVAIGDMDRDGAPDVVFSCEEAKGPKLGVVWFPAAALIAGKKPKLHDISGPQGTKFDRIELIDLDDDGDLDVVTTEEAENLGVIWYENPRFP